MKKLDAIKMTKLQVVRVDNDLVQKAELQIGNNIIGRGVVPGRNDSQTIKHAVTINLSPNNEMTITPYQVTPCYIKSTESPRWQLLKLGVTVPIKPGDICALLSDECWFKIVPVSETMENNNDYALKRKADCSLNIELPDKKICSESKESENIQCSGDAPDAIVNTCEFVSETNDKENISNNKGAISTVSDTQDIDGARRSGSEEKILESNPNTATNSNDTNLSNSKEKDLSHKDANTREAPSAIFPNEGAVESSENNLQINSQDQTDSHAEVQNIVPLVPMQVDGPSGTNSTLVNNNRRDKCVYGSKCYRKNVQHKDKFSHPGDADYDDPDDREECPYGIKCYRKNPQHKQQFKHSTAPRRRTRAAPLPSSDSQSTEYSFTDDSAEESVDESEYEPFSDFESSNGESEATVDSESYTDESGSEWDDGTTG